MAKMDWLIRTDGISENKLLKTHEYRGSIMIPTGVGKSGIMMENVIHHIKNNPLNRKYVFVFNGPQLRILSQTVNDFFAVLKGGEVDGEMHKVCSDELKHGEVMFFMNSSDSGESYDDILSEVGISMYPFVGTKNVKGFDAFLEDDTAKYAIVASCNKSLHKFVNRIPSLQKEGVNVFLYLDEAHTLTINKDYKPSPGDEDEKTYIDFSKLCTARAVYAFSATPEPDVTAEINRYNGHSGNPGYYILRESAAEHIAAGNILAPKVKSVKVNECVITGEICEMWLNEVRLNEPDVFHKILLTVKSWQEVERLESQLSEMGYKVFSTCTELGMRQNGKEFTKDVINFINTIDNYDGDCFVIHIKQLVAGIDIKSLTGCIIATKQHGDTDNYRQFIQIIGRTLRIGKGDERGMPRAERKKKFGYVLFLLPSNYSRDNMISFFIDKYYALDNLDFIKGEHAWKSHANGNIEFEDMFENMIDLDSEENYPAFIKELLANVEGCIKNELKPQRDFCLKNNYPWHADKEIEMLANEYSLSNQKELKACNVADFLTDDWLIEKVKALVKKYGVD